MKLYLASDIHNQFDRFIPTEPCDAILIAGDMTNEGINDYFNILMCERWLKTLSEIAPTYYIPGNHEIGISTESITDKATNVLLSTFQLTEGVVLAGASMSVAYSMPSLVTRWNHMTARREVEEAYYESLPPCDILVSHSPPAGLTGHDTYWGQLGSTELTNYIERNSPQLVVCGHIHEPRAREEYIGDTLVLNVATTSRYVEI